MSRNYKFHNPEGLYFVSFATVYWVDVFVRIKYFECITKNLNYCVDNKGMEIYAWCIMPSHIHFVFKSTIQKPEELLRDFKSFTSKDMLFAQAGRLRERGESLQIYQLKSPCVTRAFFIYNFNFFVILPPYHKFFEGSLAAIKYFDEINSFG